MSGGIFFTIFEQPLYNLLIFLYNTIPGSDFGVAIILLTLVIRGGLYPLNSVAIKSQKALQEIQPKIKEIREKYAKEKEKQAKALLELYKEHKVNPFSSCLPLLIQLPFLFALFKVFKEGVSTEAFSALYPFVSHPDTLNTISFGFLDIAHPNIWLAIVAGGLQFWQSRMLMHTKVPNPNTVGKDEAMLSQMNKQMMYIFPIMTVIIGRSLPAGLMVYWAGSTVFSIIQQYIVFRKNPIPAKQP